MKSILIVLVAVTTMVYSLKITTLDDARPIATARNAVPGGITTDPTPPDRCKKCTQQQYQPICAYNKYGQREQFNSLCEMERYNCMNLALFPNFSEVFVGHLGQCSYQWPGSTFPGFTGTFGTQFPFFGSQLAFGAQLPSFGAQFPSFGTPLPFGAQVPSLGTPLPFGGKVPSLGTPVPPFGAQIPTFGAHIPPFGAQIPSLGTQLPLGLPVPLGTNTPFENYQGVGSAFHTQATYGGQTGQGVHGTFETQEVHGTFGTQGAQLAGHEVEGTFGPKPVKKVISVGV